MHQELMFFLIKKIKKEMLNNNIVIVGVLEKLISFGLYLITATLLVNHIFWRCKETPLRLHCPKKVLPSDKAQQQAFYSKVNSINNSKWELGFYLKCKSTPKNRFPIKLKLPNTCVLFCSSSR